MRPQGTDQDGPSASAVLEVAEGLRHQDPQLAAALMQHAVRLGHDEPAIRRAADQSAARALVDLERGAEVVSRYAPELETAVHEGRTQDAARWRSLLAAGALAVDAPELARELLDAVDPDDLDGELRTEVLLARAGCRAAVGDVGGCDAEIRRLSPEAGGGVLAVDVARAQAGARRAAGDLVGALRLLESATDAEAASIPAEGRSVHLASDHVDVLLDLGEQRGAGIRAAPFLQTPPLPLTAAPLGRLRCALAARVHLPAGDLDAADLLAREAESDLGTRGHVRGAARAGHLLAEVAEARGELGRALTVLRRAHTRDLDAREQQHLVRRVLTATLGAVRPAGASTPSPPSGGPGHGRTGPALAPAPAGASAGSGWSGESDGGRPRRHRRPAEDEVSEVSEVSAAGESALRAGAPAPADDAQRESAALPGRGSPVDSRSAGAGSSSPADSEDSEDSAHGAARGRRGRPDGEAARYDDAGSAGEAASADDRPVAAGARAAGSHPAGDPTPEDPRAGDLGSGEQGTEGRETGAPGTDAPGRNARRPGSRDAVPGPSDPWETASRRPRSADRPAEADPTPAGGPRHHGRESTAADDSTSSEDSTDPRPSEESGRSAPLPGMAVDAFSTAPLTARVADVPSPPSAPAGMTDGYDGRSPGRTSAPDTAPAADGGGPSTERPGSPRADPAARDALTPTDPPTGSVALPPVRGAGTHDDDRVAELSLTLRGLLAEYDAPAATRPEVPPARSGSPEGPADRDHRPRGPALTSLAPDPMAPAAGSAVGSTPRRDAPDGDGAGRRSDRPDTGARLADLLTEAMDAFRQSGPGAAYPETLSPPAEGRAPR